MITTIQVVFQGSLFILWGFISSIYILYQDKPLLKKITLEIVESISFILNGIIILIYGMIVSFQQVNITIMMNLFSCGILGLIAGIFTTKESCLHFTSPLLLLIMGLNYNVTLVGYSFVICAIFRAITISHQKALGFCSISFIFSGIAIILIHLNISISQKTLIYILLISSLGIVTIILNVLKLIEFLWCSKK